MCAMRRGRELAGLVHRARAMQDRWCVVFVFLTSACALPFDLGPQSDADAHLPYHQPPDAAPSSPPAPDAAPPQPPDPPDGIDVLLVYGYAPTYLYQLE